MPVAPPKTRKRSRRAKSGSVTPSSPQKHRHHVSSKEEPAVPVSQRREPAVLMENGEPTYVLVPVDEYEEYIKASMVQSAIAKLERKDEIKWVDYDEYRLQLAGEEIAEARKAAGLTQKQLADKLHVPQSQISRIERNPDHTTVRTLKKIARALGVDVRSLV